MKTFVFVFILTILSSLAPIADGQVRPRNVSITIHREKSVPRTGMRIRFLELVDDSRCPEDIDCIWAGNAKIKIEVRSGRNRRETFELNSMTEPKVVTYAGYEISLADLTPHPRSNIRINRNGYVATFSVRRSGT
jgi:hypothetical protein